MKTDYDARIARFKEILDGGNAVFFGGAGVSTESGVPDFRSSGGIFAKKYDYPPETILSHSFFYDKTEVFFDFYKKYMMPLSARPNAAHVALARLESKGLLKAVVTQNIDGLHQAAGSKNVFELHGSVHRNYCMRCRKFYPASYIKGSSGIPRCDCGGVIKPDVVLYEEGLDGVTVQGALAAISAADTLIVGGTSLVVYPAAGFIDYFRGRHLVVINKTPTPADMRAELVINDGIAKVFSALATL